LVANKPKHLDLPSGHSPRQQALG